MAGSWNLSVGRSYGEDCLKVLAYCVPAERSGAVGQLDDSGNHRRLTPLDGARRAQGERSKVTPSRAATWLPPISALSIQVRRTTQCRQSLSWYTRTLLLQPPRGTLLFEWAADGATASCRGKLLKIFSSPMKIIFGSCRQHQVRLGVKTANRRNRSDMPAT